MNAIIPILIGLLTLLPTARGQEVSPTQAGLPGLEAQVTLPYAELKRILEQAHRKPPEATPAPPLGAALKSAHFKVSAPSAQAPLTAVAEFHSINLSGQWEWTPLMSGLQVEDIQPTGATVVNREGITGLLHREEGTHQVSLTLSGSPLRFNLAEATSRILDLAEAPPGHAWEVEGDAQRISASRYALGPGTVSVAVRPLVVEVESPWSLASELVVESLATHMQVTGRMALRATEGTGQTARIQLPSHASNLEVEGADLKEWDLVHDDRGQWLTLRWKTARILNRNVTFRHTAPTPAVDQPLVVEAPRLADGASTAMVALAASEGVEFGHAGDQQALDPASLPPWIRTLNRSSEMLAQRGTGPFEFSLNHLPRAKTAKATIPQAGFDMQLVADGSLLCTADFEISHREWTQWEFSLPEDGVLLSCHRNGERTDPILSGERTLSLQLPEPDESTPLTRVRLIYSAKSAAMDPVEGALMLQLPSTPLFIRQTDWIVRIPEVYKVQAVEGNVAIQAGKKAGEGIALTKSFNHGERAMARLHYRKRGLDE